VVGLPAIGAVIQGGLAETFGPQLPILGAMIIGMGYWLLIFRRLPRETDNLKCVG